MDVGHRDAGRRPRAHWWAGGDERAPVAIVLHGLTGCAGSTHVLGTVWKAAARGFDVVRVDLRNASGPTPSRHIGHAGRSEDVRALVDHVREARPSARIVLIGFSLGGNVALKALGEYGEEPPSEIAAAVGISVPIDLDHYAADIDRPLNTPYRRYFLRRLAALYERRRELYPDEFPSRPALATRSLRDWDHRVVAPSCGFASAEDYYARCSALSVIDAIRVPTLLIQAHDDPFIPFAPFAMLERKSLPWVRVHASQRGGHAGFRAARGRNGGDPYWVEHHAIDFCAAWTETDR